jgi:hypothetical protein
MCNHDKWRVVHFSEVDSNLSPNTIKYKTIVQFYAYHIRLRNAEHLRTYNDRDLLMRLKKWCPMPWPDDEGAMHCCTE